jgi:hypothetical protein
LRIWAICAAPVGAACTSLMATPFFLNSPRWSASRMQTAPDDAVSASEIGSDVAPELLDDVDEALPLLLSSLPHAATVRTIANKLAAVPNLNLDDMCSLPLLNPM